MEGGMAGDCKNTFLAAGEEEAVRHQTFVGRAAAALECPAGELPVDTSHPPRHQLPRESSYS